MPTSSIFETVRLTEPKEVQTFIETLEKSEKAEENTNITAYPFLTDHAAIKKLLSKRKKAIHS